MAKGMEGAENAGLKYFSSFGDRVRTSRLGAYATLGDEICLVETI
jgi:hypothetical protein